MDFFGNLIYKYVFLVVLFQTGIIKFVGYENLTRPQIAFQLGVYTCFAIFITFIAIAIENILKMQELSVIHLMLFLLSGSLMFWVFNTTEPQLVINLRYGLQYLLFVFFGFFFSSYRRRY
jgi:hypothetical protein